MYVKVSHTNIIPVQVRKKQVCLNEILSRTYVITLTYVCDNYNVHT